MTQINAIQGVGEVDRHAIRNNQEEKSQEERIEGIEKLTEEDIQRVVKNGKQGEKRRKSNVEETQSYKIDPSERQQMGEEKEKKRKGWDAMRRKDVQRRVENRNARAKGRWAANTMEIEKEKRV